MSSSLSAPVDKLLYIPNLNSISFNTPENRSLESTFVLQRITILLTMKLFEKYQPIN